MAARNHLKWCLETIQKGQVTGPKSGEKHPLAGLGRALVIDFPLDAILGWDPRSGSVGLADTNRELEL